MFTVTPIYALAVAVITLALWFRVTSYRGNNGISIGDNGDVNLLQRIRQHGNCVEWSSFILIMMILAEGMGAPGLYIHISGALLLIGRIAHPFGLKIDNAGHPLRYVGNGTNILAALNIMVCLGVNILGL
ncbi:MAPEG family protein [uncultured Sulfitobacter sp.]|uniref:MAPEG family protein n=1 Tax=uncultured Sulfitobacter sp. TaxID=191468 RepID=UPI0026385B47|nr:MAPEG family protein [uncultured Sulfitobacter sp.]